MVTMIVNMPHELWLNALTTTIATLASTAITMNSVAIAVVAPATGPTMLRAIFGSDRPSCRTEATSVTKSCTPPARHAPMTIQAKPGKVAPLRGQHRPDQRSGPGNGGEVVAEQHDPLGGMIVHAVAQPMGGRRVVVVQDGHLGRQEGPVEPIGDRKRRQRHDHQPQRVHVVFPLTTNPRSVLTHSRVSPRPLTTEQNAASFQPTTWAAQFDRPA